MPTRARDDSGGAYDTKTGRFTVPETGRYEMTLHLVSYAASSYHYFYIDLYLDDKVYDTMRRRDQVYSGSNHDDLTFRRRFLGRTQFDTTHLKMLKFFGQETYIHFVAQETRIIRKLFIFNFFSSKKVEIDNTKVLFFIVISCDY